MSSNINKKPDQTMWYISFAILVFALFLPPYFRGLFFKGEQQFELITVSFCALCLIFWILQQKKQVFQIHIYDFLPLGLLVSYILSLFVAANMRLAIGGVVKFGIYFMIFFIISFICTTKRDLKLIVNILYLSGLGVAWAGILTALGAISINDGFIAGRIYSTLQYPNTLAIYMLSLTFLGFYLWEYSNGFLKYFYTFGNYSLLLVFLSTNSRGAFIVLPVVLLLYLIFLPRNNKATQLAYSMSIFIAVFIGSLKFIPLILGNKSNIAFLWILVGLFCALLLNYLLMFSLPKLKGIKNFKVLVIILVLLTVLGGTLIVGIMQNNNFVTKIMPQQLVDRIQSININDRNSQERLFWANEAIHHIVLKNPVLGLGGGAWESTYQSFQAYGYSSTQVHNDWIQLWAEIGTLGLLFWLSTWFFFLLYGYYNWKNEDHEIKVLQIAVLIAGIAIGAHSMIDFDLSLSAVTIFLFSMFGLTNSMNKLNNKKTLCTKHVYIGIVAFLSLGLFLLSSSLTISNSYAQKAVQAAQSNHIEDTLAGFQKASKFDPFEASYKIDMARIYAQKKQIKEAIQCGEQAKALDTYNWKIYASLSQIYWQDQKLDKVIEGMDQSIHLAKWNSSVYENASKAYAFAGIHFLQSNDTKQAKIAFDKGRDLVSALNKDLSRLTPKEKWLWETLGKPYTSFTPSTNLYIGMNQYFVGEYDQAILSLNNSLVEEQIKGEGLIWLALCYEKINNLNESTKYLNQAEKINGNLIKNFEFLKQLPQIK
jgi:tetratricopeptide (TPR) repeat protein